MINSKKNIITIILIITLILVSLLSVKVTVRLSHVYLDGDTSADMLLANHLYKTGGIMSKDWYYGSEPRIIHNQLAFTPLFNFFSDWTTVRIIGILILQLILVTSYAYMMKKAEMSIQSILLGMILLLLPYNSFYGRFVLYQVFYITYLSYSFLLIGLLFSVIRSWNKNEKFKTFFRCLLLFMLSFITCLQGFRPFVTTIIPLLLLIYIQVILNSLQSSNNLKSIILSNSKWLFTSFGILFFGLAGVLAYKFYILTNYSCMNYADITTNFISTENFRLVIYNIIRQFGFRENLSVTSIIGLLSILSIYTAGYTFINSFHAVFTKEEKFVIKPKSILRGMMITSFFCIIIVNLLTNDMLVERYMLPASVWMIPLICISFNSKDTKISTKWLLNIFCIITFSANGFLNSAVFLERPEISDITIKSASYYPKKLEKAIRFLTENEYTYGIADHWIASVITELTDGLPVSSITWYNSGLRWYNLLTPESFRHLPEGKTFFIVGNDAVDWLKTLDISFQYEEVYRDKYYTIFDIPDLNSLRHYFDMNRNDGNDRITSDKYN